MTPIQLHGSLDTEFKTLDAMMRIYCHKHHARSDKAASDLCHECSDLLEYAKMRLDRCPYGEQKPTCNRCSVHCYKPLPKAKMKQVMIYSGPRMLLPHPILAIRHLLKERQKPVGKPVGNQSNRAKRRDDAQRGSY